MIKIRLLIFNTILKFPLKVYTGFFRPFPFFFYASFKIKWETMYLWYKKIHRFIKLNKKYYISEQ